MEEIMHSNSNLQKTVTCFQCFDIVGWVSGKAFSLQKSYTDIGQISSAVLAPIMKENSKMKLQNRV